MTLIDTTADRAVADPAPAAPRAAVEITDLSIRRGTKLVIDGITTQIPAGSLTGLLGPSGCGKTTFLRAIVGVQRIQSGSVTVLGKAAGDSALRGTSRRCTASRRAQGTRRLRTSGSARPPAS